MNWFAASMFYRGIRSDNQDESLWEERVVLLKAETMSEALENARKIGPASDVAYETSDGSTLAWKFQCVERIVEIEEESLVSGTEIFSRFLREAEARSLLTPFDD